MSDEALRVLEKDVRRYAETYGIVDKRGMEATMVNIADRIAAILTTQQEVAPVVGPYVLDEDGELACGAAEEAPAPEKVICPSCCHQFHAISERDQARMKEVAPVAWTDDRGLERLREGKQEMVSGARLGSDTTPLYTGQTSDARDGEITALRRCLGFFASVIKSGEPWTATCQSEYDAATQTTGDGK